MKRERVDFAVVGSGAAGGIVAKELATGGFSVAVLEQGPRVEPATWQHDELRGALGLGLAIDAEQQPQTFRRTEAEVATRLTSGGLRYHRLVGGGSMMFSANYWRFRELDFREASLLGPIAGTGLADWPLTYADLEPYYTKAEWELGVSGAPGPFDPPRSRPYPMPPLPVKSSGVLFEHGARQLGLHPQPVPLAILSQPLNGRPPCQHCGFCYGQLCEHRAKSGTAYTVLPIAEATGRCEVRPDSYVHRVETDASGRATGVVYFDADKLEHFQPARAVVLCCNGAETPRLLLMSASPRFPDGLANSSGLVGRYLVFNGGSLRVNGLFERPLNEYKSVVATRMALDFYASDPARGFYGGGGLDSRGPWAPLAFAQGELPAGAPRWGREYKKLLGEYFTHSMSVSAHTTTLPLHTNSISLDSELKDAWGLPAPRVTYQNHPDDLATFRFFRAKAREILEAAGATRIWGDESDVRPQTGGSALLGTCRMGRDPATSVVDPWHRAHDVPNLFMCDGSSLVTGGRGQPTATIQALAYRAGEAIARFARRGEI